MKSITSSRSTSSSFIRGHHIYAPSLAGILFFVLATLSASPQSEESRKDIDIQRARNRMVKERGSLPRYTKKWDLSDLPEYKPEQKVAGTLRISGLNYLADCNLSRYWEDGFRKYHPDLKIEWHLKTTLTAIP